MSDSTTLTQGQRSAGEELSSQADNRRLLFVRVLWLVFAPLLVALTCFFIPLQITATQALCEGDSCSIFQPDASTVRDLHIVGLSLPVASTITIMIILACALTWFVIAIIIAWKNFTNWFALSVSFLALVQTAMATRPPGLINLSPTSWQWIIIVSLVMLNGTIYIIVGILFPNGKLAPRWTRLILVAWFVIGLPCGLLAEFPLPLSQQLQDALNIVSTYCWDICIGTICAAQVYRYRRFYGPVERQQTKWVLFFGCIALLQQIIQFSLPYVLPMLDHAGSLYYIFYYPTTKLFLILLGLALLFAMLRYRLWDIDVIINRALVYGLLTVLLALVYVGLIYASQAFLHEMTGQAENNPLVLVSSTLVIAALFQPLRTFIQRIIDHRFYRSKYNAEQVISDFTTTLRGEIDLVELQRHLVKAIEQTMQPTHISLWLRPTRKKVSSNK